MESAERSLICWSSDAVSIACDAAATAGDAAVVSVNAVPVAEGVDESEVVPDFSVTQPTAATAARTTQLRRREITVAIHGER
jgi:hypothetical protein